jgi:hypothetical protein
VKPGLGDVLDAYLAPEAPARAVRGLVFAVEPGARVAAGVAAALASALHPEAPRALTPRDSGAAALLGAPLAASGEAAAALATSLPTGGERCVLVASPACAGRWVPGACAPELAFVLVGDASSCACAAPREAGRRALGVLPERTALRVALGGRSPEIARLADAIARWRDPS